MSGATVAVLQGPRRRKIFPPLNSVAILFNAKLNLPNDFRNPQNIPLLKAVAHSVRILSQLGRPESPVNALFSIESS